MTKIRLVKMHLKILAALALVAIVWFGARHVLSPRKELISFHTLTVTGEITPEAFVQLRDDLVQSVAEKKTIVITSPGGDGPAALAIGILMHRHNWDVEVVDYCESSCAIFIFPAGKKKYLNDNSLLLFHGGPYQENMLEMASKLDQEYAKNGAPAKSVVLGQATREGNVSLHPNRSPASQEVFNFLSMKVSTLAEGLVELRSASDRFYQELGINPLLPTYGQIGSYEPIYKSYKYQGFIYRLDSLRKLGVSNIELKDGEWHPERNPAYEGVYEVTYP